jgi:hypothetical protein
LVVKSIVREVEMDTVGIDFERIRQCTHCRVMPRTKSGVICIVRCGIVGAAWWIRRRRARGDG